MNAAAAINILTVLAGVDKPVLKIVSSYQSGRKNVRFQAKYSPMRDSITITQDLLADFTNEAELAFMLAHELGHRALRHGYKFLLNRQKAEQEADAYAIRAMRRVGFDVTKVPWWFDRRISSQQGTARRKMAVRKAAILNIIEGVST